ncbi:MAG TPA: thiamine pyrophosphate-dependent enzyme, partial [Burkholderiaceae bacterium]|nr:thiamine pyrophosphate-dependent enzyme [Burkholderiaceae bacterium]
LDYAQAFGPGTLGLAKWAAEVPSADRLPEYVARAFRTALQGRPGPVVLALPEDVLATPTTAPVVPRIEPVHAWPQPRALEYMRLLLMKAERPLAIIGGPGWTADSACDFERFAESWELPVACAWRFQDTFDNRHRLYAGDVGLGMDPALAQRVREADLLLAIGVRLGEVTTGGYALLEPPMPQQALVHIHPGAEELGRVYQPTVAIQCAMACVGEALEGLEPTSARSSARAEAAHAQYLANQASAAIAPLDPAALVRTIGALAPEDAIFASGAGNYAGWLHRFHRYVGARHHGRTQLAPTSGAMGYGLPAAVAASLLQPDRTVIHLSGDGDLLMASQEMATATAYGAGRASGRLVSIVFDNGIYGTIRMHQEREYPGRVSGTDLVNPDFAALARAYGWLAERIERTSAFEPAFARALVADRPTLLHVVLDAEVISTRTTLSALRDAARPRSAG